MNHQEYEERMKDPHYKDLVVTKAADKKDYVFISYRGNSWRKALSDIVYHLQNRYGLRVYFDKAFASDTNVWVNQFQVNMDSVHCKAFLCILDEGYITSYATLLELMHAMNKKSKLSDKIYAINMLPKGYWEENDGNDSDDDDTGLGKENPDNPGWKEEKVAFDREFDFLSQTNVYHEIAQYYYSDSTSTLCVGDCKSIMQVIQPKNKRDFADSDEFYEQFIINPLRERTKTEKYPEGSVFEKVEKTSSPSEVNTVAPLHSQSTEINTSAPSHSSSSQVGTDVKPYFPSDEGYTYTIFGKEYRAGKKEQGKLMYDAFEALTEKFPDKAEMMTRCTSVARAEDVTDANTQKANPVYFRACKRFTVGNRDYYVGTSYGLKDKLSQIKGMFKACGADPNEFAVIENKSEVRSEADCGSNNNKFAEAKTSADEFCYTLWNKSYTASGLSAMMHDVFDIIAQKYPEKTKAVARDSNITFVALKSDVDEKRLPESKLNYFRANKEHRVGDTLYYVSTNFNRDQGIGQLKKMLVFCEGNSDAFIITYAPEKKSHKTNGKCGIGELLND